MTKITLVTSAAGGTQGQTGRHVSEMLLQRGHQVRAFVRQIDSRSDRLKSLGADIFVGDFLDVRSVEQAARASRRSILPIRSRTDWQKQPRPWPSRRAGMAFRGSSTS